MKLKKKIKQKPIELFQMNLKATRKVFIKQTTTTTTTDKPKQNCKGSKFIIQANTALFVNLLIIMYT